MQAIHLAMNTRTLMAMLAVVVVIAVAGGALAYWHAAAPPAPTSVTVPTPTPAPTTVAYAVALTDPPSVPAGTTAVLVNYSGVGVHAEDSGWIYANASGSVDLLALQNLSVVLAQVSVPANATVNEVRLYVANASAVVNGTEYPLMLPSGVLKMPVTNASRAAQGALVDLQPRVVEAYVGDQPVFVMAPAAVAVPLNYTAPPGTVHHVPKELRAALARSAANVTVTSAAIRVAGNETTISVTVRNDGGEPVQVLGIGVDGEWSLSVPPITVQAMGFSATIRVSGATAKMHMVFFANGTQLVPALQLAAPRLKVGSPLPPNARRGNMTPMGGGWGNGTPFTGPAQSANWTPPAPPINVTPMPRMPATAMPGYALGPGQSATFTFEGTIALGPRMGSGGSAVPVTITIAPIAGQVYGITVMTIPASNATATATAS